MEAVTRGPVLTAAAGTATVEEAIAGMLAGDERCRAAVEQVVDRLQVQVGFLGGLTTFSSFAAESTALAQSGRWSISGVYVVTNLLLCWASLLVASALVKGSMT